MSVQVNEPSAGADASSPTGEAHRSMSVSAEMVRCLLPEFDHVSLTLLDDVGVPYTAVHAGHLAKELDQLQYGLGEGPCITSLRDAGPVVAPFVHRDERWQRYVTSASGLGLRSQVSAPVLGRDGDLLGALNMYSTTRTDVAPTSTLIAKALAAQVAGALGSLRETEQLKRALVTRTTIGVAIGMLMEQYQITEEAAFSVLRRRSSHANVKLRDIAEQMVTERSATGLELPPADETPTSLRPFPPGPRAAEMRHLRSLLPTRRQGSPQPTKGQV